MKKRITIKVKMNNYVLGFKDTIKEIKEALDKCDGIESYKLEDEDVN